MTSEMMILMTTFITGSNQDAIGFFVHDLISSLALSPDLAQAFHLETEAFKKDFNPHGMEPSIFLPPPQSIRDVLRLKDMKIRNAWLAAYRKELKTLIEAETFSISNPQEGEPIIPIMDDCRVKILSDGTVDKFKVRIVFRGDLQRKIMDLDSWSPTISQRALKLFLAEATRLKCRVRQLDFIGAFLQTPMRCTMYTKLPHFYGELFPEYKKYCGCPLRLEKALYGTSVSGKYWYEELDEFLQAYGFVPSPSSPSMYVKTLPNKHHIVVLNYVDDMLYYATDTQALRDFEHDLTKKFKLELKGQAQWYLSICIQQHKNFDISINQDRYVQSILKRFLPHVKVKQDNRRHPTPLPSTFVPTTDDLAPTTEKAIELQKQYNIDYRACIGCLLYLCYTRFDIVFATNKLAKFGHRPGETHIHAMVHLLRYIRDNPTSSLRYYSDWTSSPVYKILLNNEITCKNSFLAFSDSSWQDDQDNGRSTGAFIIFYQGGAIDYSSN